MKNKKVLILGASSDIGIAVINFFLDNDWSVLAHYNNNKKDLNKITNKRLKKFGFNLKDVSKFQSFINKDKSFKDIDAFVSLTGYIESREISKIDLKSFYNHINVNYLSNLLVIQKILPFMSKKKFGRILLSSSTGVKFGGGKTTGLYSLTKYMNEFFFNSYKDYYKRNILINALRIGVTETKIHKKVKGKDLKKRIKLIPIKRMADVNEVAKYVFFYASDQNSLTTNEIIDISGGEK